MFWRFLMGSENMVMKDMEDRRLFEFNLSELSQCALPSKNEVEFQFVEEDTTKTTVVSFLASHSRKRRWSISASSFPRATTRRTRTQPHTCFSRWFFSARV